MPPFTLTPALARGFDAARSAYRSARPVEAYRLADAVAQAEPRFGGARHLMGLALLETGDLTGAERELRAAIALDRREPTPHVSLGQLLENTGRAEEAERAYRLALAIDRRLVPAATRLARLLLSLDRPAEALQVTAPLAASAEPAPEVLEVHARALRMVGRGEEAVSLFQRAQRRQTPSVQLELAGLLRELGRYEEAEAAARSAVQAAPQPAALVVWGTSLEDLGRYEAAESAYRQAVRSAPLDPLAHQALAQLLWSRTADPAAAAAPLEAVLRRQPTPALLALRAKLFNRAGAPAEAYRLLASALAHGPDDVLLNAAAATAAGFAGEYEAAFGHAERAASRSPDASRLQALLAETSLAAGRPEKAAQVIESLLKASPNNQQLRGLLATAWRLTGDPRYSELYDYERVVKSWIIEPPKGWTNLDGFLSDLADALKALHAMRGDPLDQSLRNGTQTGQNLALSTDPVIRGFFEAIDAPIRAYMAGLGRGKDPLRARNTGKYRVIGAWSVRLHPNGFHTDHLHPDGWLSSAFYVELPKAVEGQGREGWIKFGQPGSPTTPALGPEHFVKPDPGRLVLFPSYMWHGTVPFSGDETRLTMAFDVVPAR